jgi:glycosyltransferase involved in cell wall biosynthesis
LLFSISANTTSDLSRYIPSFNSKIPVVEIALGYDRKVFTSGPTDPVFLADFNLSSELQYVMFVGNAEPRRNLESVIKAVARCNESLGKGFHLVICGRNDSHREEIFRSAEREGILHCVHIIGYLADEELAKFYRHARAYVYPSFYEGFGLTVIEAMACGCPVITSNTSSLKDVAGEAAMLVDPNDQASISTSLEKILSDENHRQKLILAGYKNIEKYDWDMMVETIVTALKGLAINAHHH